MIKEFRVRNFMNFRDELVFSFENEKNYGFNEYVIANGVIKDAVVVGYNACGKTNLGKAMIDIVNHLTDKNKMSISRGLYTNLQSKDKEAHFSYVFQFGEHQLKYLYDKLDSTTITREKILIDGKKILSRDYDGMFLDLAGAETLNMENVDETISFTKYVFSNTTLDAKDVYSKTFLAFKEFVNGMLLAATTDEKKYAGFSNIEGNIFTLICNLENGVSELQKFLENCGIYYDLVEIEDENGKNIYCMYEGKYIRLSSMCSSGTRSLVFFFYWYKQHRDIKFIYLDEFDAFYHTDLSKRILKYLMETEDMQVVVSTHNTDIISNELLRPDCYFELEENEIQPFYKKTQKALREAHNLQKMYKAGAFHERI